MIRDLLHRLFRPARLIELVATQDGGYEIKRPRTLRDVIEDQEQSHFKENMSLRVGTPEWAVLVDQLTTEIDDNPSLSQEELVAKLISTSLRISDEFIARPVRTELNGADIEIFIQAHDVSSTLQSNVGQPLFFCTFAIEHKKRAVEVLRQIASASLASLLIADLIGTQQPCQSLSICRQPLEAEINHLCVDDWRKLEFFEATYSRYGYQNADGIIEAMMKEGVIYFLLRKWLEDLPECDRFFRPFILRPKLMEISHRSQSATDSAPRRPAM